MGPETAKMSNLITDMIIADASIDEMARAVNHSAAVINYEKSAQDNDIDSLMKKYQK